MEIEVVNIGKKELAELLYNTSKQAAMDALAEQNDELLTVVQLCSRIPGMTRHTFNNLKDAQRLKGVSGKYSLAAVRKAMQA